MNQALEKIYTQHHEQARGRGFVLMQKERGEFLRSGIKEGSHVLDIGCRDGGLTAEYIEKAGSVLGLDIDAGALAIAQQLGVETRQLDLNGEWGVDSNSFDHVVAAEVVEHLYYPDVVFRKIAEVLKPGGTLLGTVPNAFSLRNRMRYMTLTKRNTPLADPTHINHFTVGELTQLLEKHFDDVRIIGAGRLGLLAARFPQEFAFDLFFTGTAR